MESTDSLVSQASSLPPMIAENKEYMEHLPPALPPKRHRTNIKLNNLNITPPSSPKLILSESFDATANDLSSQSLNNNSLKNNRNKLNDQPLNALHPPTSPSSNYVQMSTSAIKAATAAEAAKQNNETTTATTTKTSPAIPKSNKEPISNNGKESNAANNDVRVIYTNVNILNTTNNRSSDISHYIQLCDGSNDGRKPNSNPQIECDTKQAVNDKDSVRCPLQQNSSQIINHNNNSINDKHDDDEEDIVVLRRPQASSNSSLKVAYLASFVYKFSFRYLDTNQSKFR